jgi:hypothetical protein
MTIQLLTESPYIYFNSNPVIDKLLENQQVILREFMLAARQRLIATDKGQLISHSDIIKMHSKKANDSMYIGSFKSITLYMTSNFLDDIEKKEARWKEGETERFAQHLLDIMPWNKSFINEYKDIIGAYNFNVSYPGSRLQHHLGLDPNYIRLHFCIKSSPDCTFDIEGWRHVWEEGEIFGFDDGNVFHGTDHIESANSSPRVILMIDMLKSYLKPYARTWPCRSVRPTKDDILKYVPLKSWDC